MNKRKLALAMASAPRALVGRIHASAAPRALVGRVQAGPGNQSPADLMAELKASVDAFKARHEGQMDEVQRAIDDFAAFKASDRNHAGDGSWERPDDPNYSKTFASFFRRGQGEDEIREANASGDRAQIHAAMSTGDNGNGGYLAPTEWDRRISKAQTAKSPMRRLATVQPTTVGAYSTLWNDAAWGSGWVGETAGRPQTGNAQLAPVTFASGEIYANVAATQRLLDDAGLNVEVWLTSEVEEEFNKQEGIAFIAGNGVNKPFGLLTYVAGGAAAAQHPGGVLDVVPTGHATTIPNADVLVDFTYGLAAPYRQNASWLMNSMTGAAIAKMKDGQGNYIWRESLIVGQPPTLLGRPVEFDENMPNIGAGAMPIAFGDFAAGYLINDRMGVRVLRDPYTNKPYVMFYVTKRVGGGVQDPRAIRLLKVAAA